MLFPCTGPPATLPITLRLLSGKFFQFCSQFESAIICGDFNGKSRLWSTLHPLTNVEGKSIEGAILNSLWSILNDRKSTWNSADSSGCSAIDLTVVSHGLASQTMFLGSQRIHFGSDHFPIVTRISDRFSGSLAISTTLLNGSTRMISRHVALL